MTTDLLQPEFLDQCKVEAEKLTAFASLPFQQQKWRGMAGEMAGSGVGSSIDFHDQRIYAPGDDPRHINWQAFARSGDYQMKLYREEVRPDLQLIVDASASMIAFPDKARRFVELMYFCLASAAKVGARVQTYLLGSEDFYQLDEATMTAHGWVEEFAKLLHSSQAIPALGAFPLRPKSMRVFLSDLLFPADPDQLLKTLNYQGAHSLVIAPQALEESAPDWSGNYQFHDPETKQDTPLHIAPEAHAAYLKAYQAHFGHWQRACSRQQTSFLQAPSDLPLASFAGSF